MEDLSLISTDKLIEELLSRHEHAIFIGMKIPKDNEVILIRRWKGNTHTCMGLSMDLAHCVLSHFSGTEIDIGKEDS